MIKQCKGYDTRSLRARDWARTSVTHGKAVRHPHVPERIGLSGLFRSFVANVGNDAIYCMPKDDNAMPCKNMLYAL